MSQSFVAIARANTEPLHQERLLRRLTSRGNGFRPFVAEDDALVLGVFQRQVELRGTKPAIVCSDASLTYRELDQLSNDVGNGLRKMCPRLDGPVVLLFDADVYLFGAILVLIIIAAMNTKGGNAPAPHRASQSGANGSPLGGKYVAVHFKTGKTLDGVMVDETEYGIYSPRVTSSIGGTEFTEATRADGRFVILELVVRNDSKEAREISLTTAKLIDANGNTSTTSSEGETALTMSGDREAEFLLSQLQPGIEKYLKIVFDVPAGRKAFTLRIPHGMFSGGEDGELGVHL